MNAARLMLLLLTLSAASASAAEASLGRWIDRELIPYVTGELQTHPRFRGETLMFVVFDDNAPTPRASELTLSVRDRLLDAALDTGGIHLGWSQGSADGRRAAGIDCTRDNVHYYVGVAISREVDGSYELAVRALDLEDRSWVPGFGAAWRGRLDAAERRAVAATKIDRTFLGDRDAPFAPQQTDLLAAHLAHELSCALLGQTNGAYVLPAAADSGAAAEAGEADAVLDGAVELIGNNVASYGAFELTQQPERANAALSGKAHRIDGALYQYWLTVTPTDADSGLTTLSASAYILLPGTALAEVGDADEERGQRSLPAPVRPAMVSIPNAGADALIDPLRLRTPAGGDACRFATAWVQSAASWSGSGRCSLLAADSQADAVVFFLRHAPQRGLARLGAGECRERTRARVLRRGETAEIPIAWYGGDTARVDEAQEWLLAPPADTYYAVAVDDAKLARRIANHIDRLPLDCGSSRQSGLRQGALRDWLQEFAMLAASSASHIDWRAVEIRNVL